MATQLSPCSSSLKQETKLLSSRFITVPRSSCFSTWVSRVQFNQESMPGSIFISILQMSYAGNVEPEGKEASFPFSESKNVESRISITVVGASGDLAKKKIFPALFTLFYEEFFA
ncbi:hypothetical protein ACOSP7_002907 [Xanthoceras sorbifolium]